LRLIPNVIWGIAMIKIIPAHLEDGHAVPDAPLPDLSDIKSVRLLVELTDAEPKPRTGSIVARLHGLLRGHEVSEQDYRDYLEQKYQ
jgi:hypothetical protein